MNTRAISKLKEIVGPDNVMTSSESRIAYSYDATAMEPHLPEAVVRPASADQISKILSLANEESFGVIPRGSGTSLSGGVIPTENTIVLLTNHWNKILEIDSENLTVTVEPGVITAQLQEAVEKLGFIYPPDPGSSSICTIGGNVAENAGGLRGLKYGVTKNYVMGMEVVLPDGDVLWTGGKSVKDVAGFDLKSMLVGSEGTLGIFTKIILKIIPKPEASRTILAFFPSLEDAAKTVMAIIAAKITPAMLEFLDHTTIRCVEEYTHLGLPVDAEAMLLIEVDGKNLVIGQDVELISSICTSHHASSLTVAADDQQALRLKSARRSAFPSLARATPTTIMEDVAVPRAALADLVHRINLLAKKYDLTIGNFGHAGDGNLHPNYLTDERDRAAFSRAMSCVEEVEETAITLGGTITGEHGVGLYKKRMLEKMVHAPALRLMQQVKSMIDPNNILNPGKVIDFKPRCEGILPKNRSEIKKFEDVAWV